MHWLFWASRITDIQDKFLFDVLSFIAIIPKIKIGCFAFEIR